MHIVDVCSSSSPINLYGRVKSIFVSSHPFQFLLSFFQALVPQDSSINLLTENEFLAEMYGWEPAVQDRQ